MAETTGAIYEPYVPQRIRIPGSQAHPSPLSQSAAMGAIEPPPVTYKPNLPAETITSGQLSEAQVEAVIYAGQAHAKKLPDGRRRGFFIGDGTGVGKGREIAAVILDNMRQGRRKALWLSETQNLEKSAQRDITDIGGETDLVFNLKQTKPDQAIQRKGGVLYTTYATLAGKRAKNPKAKTRLDQLVGWLGADFDGVIVFDEAHNMGNAQRIRAERGWIEPSKRALAGVELQARLPNARVLYTSATGATEVSHLSYADRLGLWGEGTPFANRQEFSNEIAAGGVAAMELVSRDMKALGLYMARTLSFHDPDNRPNMSVEVEPLEHTLTGDQVDLYDEMARAWQIVLDNVEAAVEMTASTQDGKTSGRVRGAALSVFWSNHQRFFNSVITAMKMPSVIQEIEKDRAAGRAVVMQLVNTGEAQASRAIARMTADDEVEDLDFSPKDMLLEYVQRSFPVAQWEQYTDENDQIRWRLVTDSQGTTVENPEAVALREETLLRLASLRVPENPLDIVINHFGPDAVAEITGRKQRVIKRAGEASRIERRPNSVVTIDAAKFQDGKKKILIFSDKGGTGESYHADKRYKNQDRRVHYLLQPGWRANKAIQGMGRTHRSNQSSAPIYRLVSTDLKAEKRFTSTIARRLDQLGALTKGQRETGGGGLFSAADNLESREAKAALRQFYEDLNANRVEGLSIGEIESEMGLDLIDPETGGLKAELPPITRFLNRLLSLEIARQNEVFDHFFVRLEEKIEAARERGELDLGVEDLRAVLIEKNDETTVYTHKETGAETKLVELEVKTRVPRETFAEVSKRKPTFYVNVRSERVWAAGRPSTLTDKEGRVLEGRYLRGPSGGRGFTYQPELDDPKRWRLLDDLREAEQRWTEHLATLPEFDVETVHLLTGVILPIWDRVVGQPMVRRGVTNEGERILGRRLFEEELAATLQNLGVEVTLPEWAKDRIAPLAKVLDGWQLNLSNGWKIVRRRIEGENRVEIIGPQYGHHTELTKHGVLIERISFATRYFIPIGAEGSNVFRDVTRNRDIVEVLPPSRAGAGGGGARPGDPAQRHRLFVSHLSEPKQRRVEQLERRLSSLLGTTLRMGVEPRMIDTAVRLGSLYAEAGVRTFASMARFMVDRFGGKIRPHLVEIYTRIRALPSARRYRKYMDPLDEVEEITQDDIDVILEAAPEKIDQQPLFDLINRAMREEPGEFTVGRPELAIPATSETARAGVRVAQEVQRQLGEPERHGRDEFLETARERLKEDYERERRRLIGLVDSGSTFNAPDTVMAAEMVAEEGKVLVQTEDPQRRLEALNLLDAWIRAGSEAGRAFAFRHDPLKDPVTRRREHLAAALATPNSAKQRKLRELLKKARKAVSEAEVRKWMDKRRELMEEDARIIEKIKKKLLTHGIDLENLTDEQLMDPRTMALIARIISATKSRKRDWPYEYWISAILSLPTTQMANITGNTTNLMVEMLATRPTEALVNTILPRFLGGRNVNAAHLGELKWILRGIWPGMRRAYMNMIIAWDTERPVFSDELRERAGQKVERGDRGAKIPGPIGRAVRFPLRGLLAMDEAFKGLAWSMHVYAVAYRRGHKRKLKGEQLQNFIQEEISDIHSNSSSQAFDFALEMTFQDKPTVIGRALLKLRGMQGFRWLKFIVPFITTPDRIFAAGLRKSPLGGMHLMYRLATDGVNFVKGGRFVHQLAEQTLAWGLVALLWDWTDGDDDDPRPKLTGTVPFVPGKQRGLREQSYRVPVPAMSIRIGGKYRSYSRIEPAAVTLAATIDGILAIKRSLAGKTHPAQELANTWRTAIGAMREKTFLRGVSDIIYAVEEGQPGRLATNFATSWVPNIVRGGARSGDPYIRETRVAGKLGEGRIRMHLRRAAYGALPLESFAPPPKVDLWGREVKKDEGVHPLTDWIYRMVVPVRQQNADTILNLDRLILNWNNAHADDIFVPRVPDRFYTVRGERMMMADAEYHRFLVDAGQRAAEKLLAKKLNYADPTERDIEKIRRQMSFERRKARNEIAKAHRKER